MQAFWDMFPDAGTHMGYVLVVSHACLTIALHTHSLQGAEFHTWKVDTSTNQDPSSRLHPAGEDGPYLFIFAS